jgi:hypothetical protein
VTIFLSHLHKGSPLNPILSKINPEHLSSLRSASLHNLIYAYRTLNAQDEVQGRQNGALGECKFVRKEQGVGCYWIVGEENPTDTDANTVCSGVTNLQSADPYRTTI